MGDELKYSEGSNREIKKIYRERRKEFIFPYLPITKIMYPPIYPYTFIGHQPNNSSFSFQ